VHRRLMTLCVVVAIAAIAVPVAAARSLTPRAGTLTIAFEGPLTGGQASNGQDMLRGTKLAIAEINKAGGVLGMQIKLITGNDKATAYLDMSGDGLHRRGYRQETGEAPLRETLAAALLRMSGWDRKTPFLDPMCGSGTIAIEAAMWATNRAPGLNRERFGFERWANFDEDKAERMRQLRGELRGSVSGNPPRIQACDIDGAMIEIAKRNARAAGVRLSFKQRSILDLQRGESARRCVLTNPPYDARLGADEALRQGIASAICRMHGSRVALLSGHKDYQHYISARPQLGVELLNGAIKCHFLVYEID